MALFQPIPVYQAVELSPLSKKVPAPNRLSFLFISIRGPWAALNPSVQVVSTRKPAVFRESLTCNNLMRVLSCLKIHPHKIKIYIGQFSLSENPIEVI